MVSRTTPDQFLSGIVMEEKIMQYTQTQQPVIINKTTSQEHLDDWIRLVQRQPGRNKQFL